MRARDSPRERKTPVGAPGLAAAERRMGNKPLTTPTTVATRSPTSFRTKSFSVASSGYGAAEDEASERQLTTPVRARACAGREKGSPELWRG